MPEREECHLVMGAPELRREDLDQINALFPGYIFRVRRDRELWTTCCHRHVTVGMECTDAEQAILDAPHTRAPVYSPWSCQQIKRPEPVTCPFCGATVEVKELGRTGDRKNLWAYRRAMVLRQWRGALWAVAYDASKDYRAINYMCEMPRLRAIGIFRFRPGQAEGVTRSYWANSDQWYSEKKITKPPKSGEGWGLHSPFGCTSEYGMSYDLVGLDDLPKSAFRYCCVEQFMRKSIRFIEYLTACCFFPRQIEMLTKAGVDQPVLDLVERCTYNKSCFHWEEVDPRKSFGLGKEEMRAFLDSEKSMDVLNAYKRLRKAGTLASFKELDELKRNCLNGHLFLRVVSRLARYKLKVGKLTRYLQKEGRAGKKKRVYTGTMMQEWLDYVVAAEAIKLDLTNQVFLLPKGFQNKHDQVTKEAAKLQKLTENKTYQKNRLPKLAKRYTFSTDRYLIRPPVSAQEIVEEGKALKHCVGGYAERHIRGATTILFLRDRNKPGKALVTIEMKGNRIMQIHGYDDDRKTGINQREDKADILEPWLAWLEGGSKRDKKSRPVPPRKYKKERGNAA